MMKYLLTALLILISFVATAQREVKITSKPVKSVMLTEDERIKLDRNFIEAVKAKMIGDIQNAISLFSECIRIDPANAASMYELAGIYLGSGQTQPALLFASKAADLDPGNKWYQEMHAQALAANLKFREAAEVYGNLVKKHPAAYDYYVDQAFMLENAKEPAEAIRIFDKLEEVSGVSEMVILHKRNIYLRENKPEKALEEVNKLVRQYPGDPSYLSMIAEIYEATGRYEDAIRIYDTILVIDPSHINALLLLSQAYHKTGREDMYKETLKRIFSNDEVDIDKKVAILFSYFEHFLPDNVNAEKKNEAYLLSGLLIEAHPREASARAIYGDFLFHDDSLFAARDQYILSIRFDNNRFTVWKNLMLIDEGLNQFDSLLAHSEEALTIFPNQVLVYFFNGTANARLKRYPDAIASFERALVIGTDDVSLRADIWSSLGEVYNSAGDYPRSDSCFERSLVLKPLNPYTLNNFAYYLSVRNAKLSRAEEMALAANRIQPENAAFQDTYAWILYRRGRFLEAREWMEKALKNGGSERPVIIEHYGDVLFRLGLAEEAVTWWKKAVEKGAGPGLLERKIADKMLYE